MKNFNALSGDIGWRNSRTGNYGLMKGSLFSLKHGNEVIKEVGRWYQQANADDDTLTD